MPRAADAMHGLTPPGPANDVDGDDPAIERHGHDVYRWAFQVLGRHHDALDVAQDVFLKWVGRAREGDAPRQPRGWLRRTTVNRAIDLLRSRRVRSDHGAWQPRLALTEEQDPDRDRIRADIASALDELSSQQREVVVAKVWDGMTFAAIASELEVAVPTVKTHYLRALGALRERLDHRWGSKGNDS